jgi:hypothetical protein
MLKWLLGLGLVLLIAIGGGGYYLYSNLDLLVQQAIEESGSEAVGVAVRVDRVELDLQTGRASVFGLRVANPPGFEGATAFTLGRITVDIDLESIRERKPLVLDEVRIESPVVFYVSNGVGKSNLEVLADNASSESGAAPAKEGDVQSQAPQLLRVRKILFAGGRVEADTRALGGNQMEATLATATLSDVGGARGATGAEIGSAVVEELGRQTVLAIGGDQIDKLLKDQIGDDGAEAVKGLLNVFGR